MFSRFPEGPGSARLVHAAPSVLLRTGSRRARAIFWSQRRGVGLSPESGQVGEPTSSPDLAQPHTRRQSRSRVQPGEAVTA
eukprot:7334163-Prorocentrum_lima.AAC.1